MFTGRKIPSFYGEILANKILLSHLALIRERAMAGLERARAQGEKTREAAAIGQGLQETGFDGCSQTAF